jgi:hypothetical protein
LTGASAAIATAERAIIRNVPNRLTATTFSKLAMSCATSSPVSRFFATMRLPGAIPAQLTVIRSGP